jgi:hypothetical protein
MPCRSEHGIEGDAKLTKSVSLGSWAGVVVNTERRADGIHLINTSPRNKAHPTLNNPQYIE